MKTGWLSEEPDDSPAMPVTAMLLGRQGRRASVLETALARSRAQDVREAREQAASAPDSALCTQVATSEGVPEQRRLDSLQVPPNAG